MWMQILQLYLQLLFNSLCRCLRLMNKCRTSLELFFAIWFVMGNVWIVDSRFSSFQRAPKLHLLCVFLLVWNATCYSFPFILFLLLCCCVPLVSRLLGYNISMASTDKGALDDQISQLPCWRYKVSSMQPDSNKRLPKEDPVSTSYNILIMMDQTRLSSRQRRFHSYFKFSNFGTFYSQLSRLWFKNYNHLFWFIYLINKYLHAQSLKVI